MNPINIKLAPSKKCGAGISMFLSFDYDPEVVTAIKSLPQRVYDKDSKTWEVPVNYFGQVIDELEPFPMHIEGDYVKLQKASSKVPDGFNFVTKPFKHQQAGFKYGLEHNKWLLGDEQGLGKTKQVIDIAVARRLKYGYKHCLIICGVNGLKWNWAAEIKTHSCENSRILGVRQGSQGGIKITSESKLEDLKNIDNLPYFLITNVESLNYKVDTGKTITKRINGRLKEVKLYDYPITDAIVDLINRGEIEMLAMDECHKVKNPDSERGKQILRLDPQCKIAMTGTPLMNSPLDLYMILKWLGYENHSFYQFRNYHCQFGGYGGHEVVGYKHLNELNDSLEKIMLRRLKEDVLDLPEKTMIKEYVEMTPKQSKIYAEALFKILENIDKVRNSNNPLAEMIRMRQATGYTGILSTTIQESAKFERMRELVEDAVANGRKVVIFSNWTQMTTPAYNYLLEQGFKGVRITGETQDAIRQQNVDRFQMDPSINFIIGTTGAMGTGLTLTAGTIEIFLDEPWNMALKEQAIDRCHRIGQKNNLTVYTLICKDTIDERINNLVENKGAMADILVDNAVQGDKTALVNYLLGL